MLDAARDARPAWPRYGLAVGSVIVAATLRRLMDPVWGSAYPFITFYPAVLLASWRGGLGPGLAATGAAAVAAAWLWVPPGSMEGWLALAGFVLAGLVVSGLGSAMRHRSRGQADRDPEALLEQERSARAEAEDVNRTLHELIGSSALGIVMLDTDATVRLWNRAAEQIFGWRQDEVLGRKLPIVPPEGMAEFQANLRVSLEGRTFTGEVRRRRKDGSPVDISVATSALRGPGGIVVGVVTVVADVTARKRAEAAGAHLAAIVESSQDAILGESLDGIIRTWNDGAERIFGYSAAEAIGRPVAMLQPPDAPDEEARILARITRGERVEHYETVRVRKDGQRIHLSLTVSPIWDAGGAIVGASKIARDITERKGAEAERERLLASERARRREGDALAGIGRELVGSLDLDLVTRRIVEEIRSLLGCRLAVLYRVDEPTGDLVSLASSGEGAASLKPGMRLPRGAGLVGLAVAERRAVASADLLHDPRISLPPIVLAHMEQVGHRGACAAPLIVHGRLVGVLGVADVSGWTLDDATMRLLQAFADQAAIAVENARLYQEADGRRADAEAASRAKDDFLAMLGHELRNPLGAISSAVHALNYLGRPDDPMAAPRGIIDRQTQQLARLVDDLLDVSRLESGKIVLRREAVDLRELAERCVLAIQGGRRLADRAVGVEGSPVVVEGDPARLEQVVMNLLDNALKYTTAGGRIVVATDSQEGQAMLRVRDTGVGITPEMLARIFDPFVQGDRSLDRAKGGLGLGLSLVRRLVGLHGGSVAATSAGPGEGSEFVVRLPLAQGVASGHPRGADPGRAVPRRVAVIEDNADAREALCFLLEVWGHQVRQAGDGESGVELLRADPPEIALVDLGLPRLDGYAVARAVRASPAGRDLYLVALTGYGQPEDRRRARDAGFDGFLVKPVDPESLSLILTQFGGSRAA